LRPTVNKAAVANLEQSHHGGHIDFDSPFLKNYRPGTLSVPPFLMELLLNLAWLLLALPAFWLWRDSLRVHHFSSRQCILTLGCVLAMLFPVISATDDVRAIRAEVEEPQSTKRVVRVASEKSSSHSRLLSMPALVGVPFSLALKVERRDLTFATPVTHASAIPIFPPGRAPPVRDLV
jgi:hypothetical protein